MDVLYNNLNDFLLFPFGSYVLGTSTDESDIDVLCGCLPGYTIDDCVNKLENIPDVKLIAKVPSFIPLLKIKVGSTPIDITFVELTQKCDKYRLMDSIEKTNINARAVNGVLVSEYLLQTIHPYNLFVDVVVKVKKWASSRNIYGTMLGFPGGMAWTLMVAKIFQLDEIQNMTSSDDIFQKFLIIYNNWHWPTPIVLTPKNDGDGSYKNWNPLKYTKDLCFMAVITPIYPTMNSTYSVNHATLQIIKREIYLTLTKPNDMDRKYTCIKFIVPDNDDGSFKLKLKGIAAKLDEIPGVEYAHPLVIDDSHYIGLNCSANVDVTNSLEDYKINNEL